MNDETTITCGETAIVGLGLIGGSLALALRRGGQRGRIVGVSSSETLTVALDQGMIDEGYPYDRLGEVAARVDLLVLATPIHRIREQLRELGESQAGLRPGTVVTDVGSTKRVILAEACQCLPPGVHFVGGHPMAGSERRGLAAADPFLFQNAIYALTPAPGVPETVIASLGRLLGETGARVVVLSAQEHDRIAAAISHVPQLLAVALVNFLEDLGPGRDRAIQLAAGGFRDMTRIASSPFDIWRDILATNADEVRRAVESFSRHLGDTVAGAGRDSLGGLFDRAATTRAAIPKDTKGFLRPLWELLVVVEDRPGMIAQISTTLAAEEINIKDIEVLKIREDEGGTMRLAFSSREDAERARTLLAARGLAVRLRT